jgi:hypothetical protein
VRSTGLALALLAGLLPAPAGAHSDCRPAPPVLWGDGRHDDTAALNAWFRGGRVVWADTGKPVGAEIAGRTFELSAAIYIPGGTGRTITHFRFVWPWTHEEVTGDTISTGTNPARPAIASGIRKSGGDPREGIPYPAPVVSRPAHLSPRDCLVS